MKRAFSEVFDREAELVARAPGRVNLIGEHTDYNDGFVFPAAIDRHVWVAAGLSKVETRIHSKTLNEEARFDARHLRPGEVRGWGAYPASAAWALALRTGVPAPNVEAVVAGDLPVGAGLSSSAAIELAFAVAWNQLADYGLDAVELATLCRRGESEFVGVQCGIMDQFACALGKRGRAIFLDTRSLAFRYAAIPEGLSIVVCDTGARRSLAASAYNQRRSECRQAAQILGVSSLRDSSPGQLEEARNALGDTLFRRARHVISENARCLEFLDALERGALARLGELMRDSHESLRDDYEVSSFELDAMAVAAGNSPGCVGARMTGAGFGGSCVALVRRREMSSFIQSCSEKYAMVSGSEGVFHECEPADGASALE